jgi:hypothetical protein
MYFFLLATKNEVRTKYGRHYLMHLFYSIVGIVECTRIFSLFLLFAQVSALCISVCMGRYLTQSPKQKFNY